MLKFHLKTLQKVVESSMAVEGEAPYEIYHKDKRKMNSVNQLNHNVICDSEVFSKFTQMFAGPFGTYIRFQPEYSVLYFSLHLFKIN